MNRRLPLMLVVAALSLCGCAHIRRGPTASGKVLLAISDREINHLGSRLGLTNAVCFSPGRDANGDHLLLTFWGQTGTNDRQRHLVMVDENGAYTRSWSEPKEANALRGQGIAPQDPPHCGLTALRQPSPPKGYQVESVSDNWGAFSASRRLWLAKLSTPAVPAVELGNADAVVSVWANGDVVHVFTRPGWLYEEGPLQYRVYDLTGTTPKLVKEMTLPWAKFPEEMDPQSELVILKTNNRAWARTWLLDLKSGKKTFLRVWPSEVDFVFVREAVAHEWLALTKP